MLHWNCEISSLFSHIFHKKVKSNTQISASYIKRKCTWNKKGTQNLRQLKERYMKTSKVQFRKSKHWYIRVCWCLLWAVFNFKNISKLLCIHKMTWNDRKNSTFFFQNKTDILNIWYSMSHITTKNVFPSLCGEF